MIMAKKEQEASMYAAGLADTVLKAGAARVMVFNPERTAWAKVSGECEKIGSDYETKISELFELCLARNNNYKEG